MRHGAVQVLVCVRTLQWKNSIYGNTVSIQTRLAVRNEINVMRKNISNWFSMRVAKFLYAF